MASSLRCKLVLRPKIWPLSYNTNLFNRTISNTPTLSTQEIYDSDPKSKENVVNFEQTQTKMPPCMRTSMIGMGRVFISGSGIGSDTSMVSSNDRWYHSSSLPSHFMGGLCKFSSTSSLTNVKEEDEEDDAMDDEYGDMTADGETYVHPAPFELENGEILSEACLRYQTYGTLNENRDNVIVVCHALTGNASLHSWWGELLGPDLAFDTSKYFIVCANILGSCYGSTSPTSPNPGNADNKPYYSSFPDISVRDTVRLQLHMLQNTLKVKSIKSVIGGSFGGMQTLEYALLAGSENAEFVTSTTTENNTTTTKPFIRSVIPIACGAVHTAWQIAISETQRQAIYADPKWNNGDIDPDDPPLAGLSVARQIGMVSYRTAIGYDQKFGRLRKDDSLAEYGSKAAWQVKSYLEYQGEKFLSRFDPVTYVKLTEQMDTHDIGRNRGGRAKALSTVKVPSLILGIDSDVLYPLHEQEELVDLMPQSELKIIRSDAGHDGFLLEQEQVGNHIVKFLGNID